MVVKMMSEPEWFDEWVVMRDKPDEDGCHYKLKENAPDEIKKAFLEYIRGCCVNENEFEERMKDN